MFDDALTWAADVLGHAVVGAEVLTGGLSSTMLCLTDASGGRSVLRLIDREPWKSPGPVMVANERLAQTALAGSPVRAPASLGLDADGVHTGVPTHLMTWVPGVPTGAVNDAVLDQMAAMLVTIHGIEPETPFRTYQSWAPDVLAVPEWSRRETSWRRAFDEVAAGAPPYEPTFLHRDYGHRNLLWDGPRISAVVDWVEASTGPCWLDVAHAATNLAVSFGIVEAVGFIERYETLTGLRRERYWMILDVLGFLTLPGHPPIFPTAGEQRRLDDWLHELMTNPVHR